MTLCERILTFTGLVVALTPLAACGKGHATATDASGQIEDGPINDGQTVEDGRQDDRTRPLVDGPADLIDDANDGAADAGVVDASTNVTTSCDWGVFNEGTLTVIMRASGGSTMPCVDAPCGFGFSIADHRLDIPMTVGDTWRPTLLGSGTFDTWTITSLQFSIAWGWDVTWSAGQNVGVLNLLRPIECPSVGANQEYPMQTHLSIRDATGALLLLSAPGVPLAPNGQALLDSAFAPELSVSWKELGCPAYQGDGVGPEGGGRRTVGIVIRETATGNEAVATWGRNTTLLIRGEPYVLSVNQGWVFADGLGCGRAKFTLYREGYLFRP